MKTIKELRAEAKTLRMHFSTTEDGEFRVALSKKDERAAYYTNDSEDALATMRDMAKRRDAPSKGRASNIEKSVERTMLDLRFYEFDDQGGSAGWQRDTTTDACVRVTDMRNLPPKSLDVPVRVGFYVNDDHQTLLALTFDSLRDFLSHVEFPNA